MSLRTPTEDFFCATLAFQEYPAHTHPGLLNELLSVPYEFTLGQSFTFLSKPVARGRMTRQQKRLVNAGDVATSQVEAIDAARRNHRHFLAAQTAGFAETFSTGPEPASERAARAIMGFMQGQSG